MFKTSMVKQLEAKVDLMKVEIEQLKEVNKSLENDIYIDHKGRELDVRERDVAIEEAKNKLRGEMKEALITSDISRAEAIAKLVTMREIYEKADMKVIVDLINKLVDKPSPEINIINDTHDNE